MSCSFPRMSSAGMFLTAICVPLFSASTVFAQTEMGPSKHAGAKSPCRLTVRTCLTFGPNGGKRESILISCDVMYIQYCVEGLGIGKDDLTDAVIETTIVDHQNKTVATFPEARIRQFPYFGGSVICTRGEIRGPRSPEGDWLAGDYKICTEVTDLTDGRKARCTLPVSLVPEGCLGTLDLKWSHDPDGEIPASFCQTLGSRCYLTCIYSGFTIVDGRYRVVATYTIKRREGGQWKMSFVRRQLVEQTAATNLSGNTRCDVPMYRAGRYVVELKLEDLLSKEPRQANYRVPLVVVDPSRDDASESKITLSRNQDDDRS